MCVSVMVLAAASAVCSGVHLFAVCVCTFQHHAKSHNSLQENSNRSFSVTPTVNQVSERAICLCTHLTTGFGIEINLIRIQSDSLLHSLEEWCSEAAIDLQSERDSHQTDAPSLSAGS